MKRSRFLLPLAVITLLVPPATQAQSSTSADTEKPLGRLFFTPERRNALERQRQYNIRESQAMEGETLSINGVVLRSGGKKTYWVNGHVQNDDSTGSGVTITTSRKTPGQTKVTTTNGEPMADLRVGETINLSTKEKQTGIGNGSLSIKGAR
jgi:hypothetical protein